jgi:hypothetical protein
MIWYKNLIVQNQWISSSILELRLYNFSSFLFSLLMNKLFIHYGHHLIRFSIWWSPSFFSTFITFLNRFSLIFILILFFNTYITMNPINLILFCFISIIFARVSLSCQALVVCTWTSLQLFVLLTDMQDFSFIFTNFFVYAWIESL